MVVMWKRKPRFLKWIRLCFLGALAPSTPQGTLALFPHFIFFSHLPLGFPCPKQHWHMVAMFYFSMTVWLLWSCDSFILWGPQIIFQSICKYYRFARPQHLSHYCKKLCRVPYEVQHAHKVLIPPPQIFPFQTLNLSQLLKACAAPLCALTSSHA